MIRKLDMMINNKEREQRTELTYSSKYNPHWIKVFRYALPEQDNTTRNEQQGCLSTDNDQASIRLLNACFQLTTTAQLTIWSDLTSSSISLDAFNQIPTVTWDKLYSHECCLAPIKIKTILTAFPSLLCKTRVAFFSTYRLPIFKNRPCAFLCLWALILFPLRVKCATIAENLKLQTWSLVLANSGGFSCCRSYLDLVERMVARFFFVGMWLGQLHSLDTYYRTTITSYLGSA